MAQNLTALIAAVRDWSNRETDVLSDDVIKRCMRWAIDKATRTLRIVPMETSVTYTGTGNLAANIRVEATLENGRTVSSIEVPSDMIEVISISAKDSAGGTIRMFDTKADERTFFNPAAEQWSVDALWTRKGGRFYLSSVFPQGQEDSIELRYYKRPADIEALYSVVAANYDTDQTYIGLAETQAGAAGTGEGFLRILDSGGSPVTNIANVFDAGNTAEATTATAIDTGNGIHKFVGNSPSNWFVDENERVALYGSLVEVFSYLQEDDQVSKYEMLLQKEMADLMAEENMLRASGGNVQMNFNGRGLI